jgi:hypothetical protein
LLQLFAIESSKGSAAIAAIDVFLISECCMLAPQITEFDSRRGDTGIF